MMPFAVTTEPAATAKIANAFEWPGQPPKIIPSPWLID